MASMDLVIFRNSKKNHDRQNITELYPSNVALLHTMPFIGCCGFLVILRQ